MTASLITAFVWLVVANVVGMLPSRDNHWRNAYILIAVGLPVLAWVVWENGGWVGFLILLMGAWVLRWPVYYLGLWIRQVLGGKRG